jgi:threonine synthase
MTGAWAGWRGLIEQYRERLDVTPATPVVSLMEGGTPLVYACHLSEATGANVWLKVEGANPTGSFKDRGMTMAISKALEAGSKAVICASTGNTSASAAAYAAKGGLTCAVLVPDGKIALGQAGPGARPRRQAPAGAGQLRRLPRPVPRPVRGLPDDAGQLGQPRPHRRPEDRRLRDLRRPRRRPRGALPAGRQRRQHHGLLEGLLEYAADGTTTRRPRMLGFQAAGAAPIVTGQRVPRPSTIATAIRIGNPASWQQALAARDESGGAIQSVTDRQILSAYRLLAQKEGVFVEPASAASVAGCCRRRTRACRARREGRLHGDRQRPQGPDWAISGAPKPVTVANSAPAAATALGLA